jgi:hypothetical protein
MAKKKITKVSCERELPCDLTDVEALAIARELARAQGRKYDLDAKKKEVVAEYGAQIKGVDAEVELLNRKVATNSEQRAVKCEWHMDWDLMEKKLIRLDTNVIEKTEIISDSERQRNIEFLDKQSAEAHKAPYGIWNGEKFLDDDKGERYETTTLDAAIKIKDALIKDGAAGLRVMSIAEAGLTEKVGDTIDGRSK